VSQEKILRAAVVLEEGWGVMKMQLFGLPLFSPSFSLFLFGVGSKRASVLNNMRADGLN
jgi:hypothetical protein